jgi:hypothetical protein
MNNPKDLPFAAMSIMALYYISTVSPRWPYVPIGTALKIAASLALALGTRVGALVYFGYFAMLVVAVLMVDRCSNWRRIAGTAARVAAVGVAMLLLGTLFWPWAGGAPLTRPFIALAGATDYPWSGGVVFMGLEYPASELPRYYAPWWFLISTPLVVIGGAILSLFVASGRADALQRAGLAIVVLVPLAAAVAMDSTLYDGIRHLLFIQPVLVVLASAGWTTVLQRPRPRWMRHGAALALAAGLVSLLAFHVRYHPNQVVYFNAIVGGPREAFRDYELDYWGNCIRQAVEWSANLAEAYGSRLTITGDPGHLVADDAALFDDLWVSEPSENIHHLEVKLIRGPRNDIWRQASRPALHRVETPDGAVLCTVIAGPALGQLDQQRIDVASRRADRQAARW